MNIKRIGNGKYEVTTKKAYIVSTRFMSCTCPAIRTCKHLKEVRARIQDGTI